jgi:hypothetical protein
MFKEKASTSHTQRKQSKREEKSEVAFMAVLAEGRREQIPMTAKKCCLIPCPGPCPSLFEAFAGVSVP